MPGKRDSWFKRWIVTPIANQLTQGVSPDRIALTIAVGLVFGIFPILGSTTLLCALAGIFLRLNQPIVQLVNYIAYPLQLALLIPFYRAGETLFRAGHIPLSIPLLFQRFAADWWQFLKDFGVIALQGITVWALIAPVAMAVIYRSVRPPLRTFALRLRPASS